MKLASCELLIYPRLLSQLICAEDIVWPSRKLNENRNFMWPKGGKACLISLYTKCFREKSDQLVVSRCKGERHALQQANHVPLREKVEEFFGKHPGALAPLDQDIFVYINRYKQISCCFFAVCLHVPNRCAYTTPETAGQTWILCDTGGAKGSCLVRLL